MSSEAQVVQDASSAAPVAAPEEKSMSIIVTKGSLDWAYPPFILATTAAAMAAPEAAVSSLNLVRPVGRDRWTPVGPKSILMPGDQLRTPVRGLYLASMSQVYPWDRGTNFAVEIGRRTAKMILDDIRD